MALIDLRLPEPPFEVNNKMIKIKGRAITAARELLRLTQHDLAASCKISPATLSKIEGESVTPYATTIRKIAKELTARGIEFTNGTGVGVRMDYKKAAEYEEAIKEAGTHDKVRE